jgi:aminoglycoside phosphotransferase (APT) family kinase protein
MQATVGEPSHMMAVALRAALARSGDVHGEVCNLRRLTGGATKRTWAFDWVVSGVPQALVFQQVTGLATPAGSAPKLSAAQEAALMGDARAVGTPAPVVRRVLETGDELGEGYITEFVDGETLGRRVVHDPALAGARVRLAHQCGEILATIHRIPLQKVPFLQRLSPAEELRVYGNALARCGVRHPSLAYAMRWINEHLPGPSQSAVVHADFRTGNLIVGPDGVRCVLDWEIARVGDPMQDLGVLCTRTWRFGGTGEVGGFGAREDLYAAYEKAGGCHVDPERVRFWEAFSNLKWAIACVRRGTSLRSDGRQASMELSAVGRRMEEPLWDFLELTADRSGGLT